ncbi:MAG: ligand-gated channel [Hydrocarboniphaga sp.]|uniref:TonB-dependent receptor family protein n=1 Tax=Hydrocarboniphaga sp. TaxID=2033016 RepID=UPI002607BEDA|nr:TonB-dependent receptor [Hydrocarboniphaga sp.]MDB5969056.1 ligand-gated channel [Hydrocarboniphaga sp.]
MRNRQVGTARWISGAVLATLSGVASADASRDAQAPAAVETVTVTATRLPVAAFDVPASIDVVSGNDLHGNSLGVNLSESLPAVAGLLARDRQNYAQDTQISIRGFGARSTFGVRGVRLYLDGIPATQPDGQGQVSHFNIGSADRVEVLRGPFSAMYGNSSGGVIQMFTADGSDQPIVSGGMAGGSFGTWRTSIGVRASLDPEKNIDYNFNYTAFHTEGFRDHSEARRESFNTKLGWQLSTDSKLTFVLNSFSSPDAQDPLGLSRAQFEDHPSQAAPVATQFNTRKSADQVQGGAIYDLRLNDEQSIRVLGYYGQRNIEQYLAIPISVQQASATHSGGVVSLGSDYGGSDARWTYAGLLGDRKFSLVAGMSFDDLSQHRRGYNNFIGTEVGVKGALRRDETDQVYDLDEYLQASYQLSGRWSALAGVRHSQVKFDSDDHYIVGANGDDSGKADYSATTPVAGLMFQASKALHFYGAYGEGFETPTFAELGYRPDGGAGLNFDLKSSKTRNAEIGAKLRLPRKTEFDVAVFQANTDKELAVASNVGGRSTYLNIDHTRRQGVESSLSTEIVRDLRLQLAYTWLDATVRDGYRTCSSTPCPVPTTPVPAGSRIPGVPKNSLYGAFNWGRSAGWNAEIDARYIGSVPVNDINTQSAPSYTLVGLGAGYVFDLPHWRIRNFLRLDNLFGKDYVGSVIVNDGNGRYYEPGPGRSLLAGVNFDWMY